MWKTTTKSPTKHMTKIFRLFLRRKKGEFYANFCTLNLRGHKYFKMINIFERHHHLLSHFSYSYIRHLIKRKKREEKLIPAPKFGPRVLKMASCCVEEGREVIPTWWGQITAWEQQLPLLLCPKIVPLFVCTLSVPSQLGLPACLFACTPARPLR